jgi:dihydroflavonol-4-reductase
MLRYFINRRVQLYFDFVLNLVDVRDVAAGLLLAMKRGQSGHRYILGGEAISLGKVLVAVGAITDRKALRVPIPAGLARTTAAVMEFVSDHVTHRPPQEQWRVCALRCALNRYRLRNRGVNLAMRRTR